MSANVSDCMKLAAWWENEARVAGLVKKIKLPNHWTVSVPLVPKAPFIVGDWSVEYPEPKPRLKGVFPARAMKDRA